MLSSRLKSTPVQSDLGEIRFAQKARSMRGSCKASQQVDIADDPAIPQIGCAAIPATDITAVSEFLVCA
jgi:hypothetical protein